MKKITLLAAGCISLPLSASVMAENDTGLATKLSNPVANLISVPLQFDIDDRSGPNDGSRYTLTAKPVIPFSVSDDAIIISRTLAPVVSQHNVTGKGESQFGLGDTTQSFFYSPKEPTAGGIIWGLGPDLLIPTGTDNTLSGKKWGAGPTGVMLKQTGPWTLGTLVNHIWDYAGQNDHKRVSASFVEPFVAYTTSQAVTVFMNTESTYDWVDNEWSVPINLTVSKIIRFDKQIIQVGGGMRYWAKTPDETGPEGWGMRLTLTFLFPQR